MKNSFAIEAITEEALDAFRKTTDPIADSTVQKIITLGDEKSVNEVMMHLFKNSSFEKGMFDSLGSDLSGILNEYIETTRQLPEWADADKIKAGEKLFSLYGPEIFMLLNVSSLPLCYTCAKGAQVLYDTGRLLVHNNDIDPLARRLMETAQMVVNVLSEGGLSANGGGVVTLQKVRLIHASIRYYLTHSEKNSFDVAKYGQPINQEDLAGTLMSFGPVILSGLKRLNISLTEKEQNDYMHCWKVVGHLMGIKKVLLPDTYEEGFELATRILKHQSEESEAGKALTDACVQFMNYLIPGNAFNDVPAYFIDYFLQDFSTSSNKNLSACAGISERSDRKDRILLSVTKFIIGKLSHLEEHKFVQKISSYFNKKLLEGIIHHFNDGKNVQFFIPPSLQKDWGLIDNWSNSKTSPAILKRRLAIQKRIDN
ncbi:oxygenase MpaB family protein [Ekhidna sp. To15]|uniref:oxygenase MpaB family protein n=1 Tax=Ekhidna sp. To15 TaxID=3395267 RepID=UPI003F523E60